MATKQGEKTANKPAEKKDSPAVDQAAAADETAPGPRLGGRRKLLIIGAAAITVLAAGGGAAFHFMRGKAEHDADKAGGETAAPVKHKTPLFVDLDTFTVNLREPDESRFLQVKLVAEVRDTASGEILKTMMPAVRNEILLLLGSKQAQEVATREGKEKLAQEIVLAANKPLEGTLGAKAIENVNFTHMIVQ